MNMYQDFDDDAGMNNVPQMSPGRDPAGRTLQRRQRGVGVGASFTTDLGNAGKSNDIFTRGEINVVDEERQLIDKVFGIVDKDNSGDIEPEELEAMFSLFGVEKQYLRSAVNRIMQNTDRDASEGISPEEFYNLLSQKFEKGDSREEMRDLFDRINEKKNVKISVDELYKVAQMLGENMEKSDINEMIKVFKRMYEEAPKVPEGEEGENEEDNNQQKSETKSNRSGRVSLHSMDSVGEVKASLLPEEFIFIMESEL